MPRVPSPSRTPPVAALALVLLVSLAEAAGPNLARSRPCAASSVEGALTCDKAFDGPKSQASRWGSNYGADRNKDSAWIWVDLGSPRWVDSVAIYWEHSGARRYAVQAWTGTGVPASGDDPGWKTLREDTTLVYQPPPVDMCLAFLKLEPTLVRYLRIRCYKRIFEFGFSIMELEAYGPETSAVRAGARTSFRGRGSRPGYGADGRLKGGNPSPTPAFPR